MHEKILITGGAGFIGSNFVHFMAEKYPEAGLVVLDKLTYAGNLENIEELITKKRITFFRGDIADLERLTPLFERERFTVVVNFAAETHVDRSIESPGIFIQTNVVGTHNLLSLSHQYQVARFHQISTDEVYGDLGDTGGFFTEETPINPNCPYAASKAAADLLVRSYVETYGLAATISRCSNNYGPYQYPEKLIPYFFTSAEANKSLPLYGDGKNVRDWLFVRDHCDAVDLILRKGKSGEVYNIGGNNEKQNLQIAQLILDFLGKPRTLISYVEDRLAHDRRYAMDASKLERELGWRPKITFEEGIRRTFEWYSTHRDWSHRCIRRAEQSPLV